MPYAPSQRPSSSARIRKSLDRFIHHPVTELALVALILVAVGSLLGEAVYARGTWQRETLRFIGDLCSLLWALELTIRFVIARSKRRF